jgi:hypothetical protein
MAFGKPFDPALPRGADDEGAATPRSFVRQFSLLDCARMTRSARLRHSDTFPKGVFRDRSWDIMIELFIAKGEARTLCLKDAMVIAGDSPAGSVRRIDSLESAGLVQRRIDPDDHRRILIALSDDGNRAMTSFLRDLYTFDYLGPTISDTKAAGPTGFSP